MNIQKGFRILAFTILIAAVLQIFFTSPVKSSETIFSIQEREKQIEDQKNELKDREDKINEREKALDEKIKKLETLRQSITGELEVQKKQNEEKVVRLTSVLETMTPKASSALLETTEENLAVEVLKRMDIKKVAKILNVMDKNKSARLSELLTGYVNPANIAQRKNSTIDTGRQVASTVDKGSAPIKKQGSEQSEATAAAMPQGQSSNGAENLNLKGGEKK